MNAATCNQRIVRTICTNCFQIGNFEHNGLFLKIKKILANCHLIDEIQDELCSLLENISCNATKVVVR